MNEYQKGLFVIDYLQKLGIDMIEIGDAIDDKNLDKSYRIIKENPTITKKEFLNLIQLI